MATGDTVSSVNAKIMGYFSGAGILKALGWIFFVILAVGGCVLAYIIWKNKRIFNKKITVFDIVGINFVPAIRDKAKTVKIGSGGFEILYLKKLKIFRIAYGGRVGKDTYYFFILPDGYWYNGMLSANMMQIDKTGGLIPVMTTNPMMRSQYTSLEKQIDFLHKAKVGFMEKYGAWVMGISFVLVAGVLLWLCYREFSSAMGAMSGLATELTKVAANVCGQSGGAAPTGLVPIS